MDVLTENSIRTGLRHVTTYEELDEVWKTYKEKTLPSWRRDPLREELFWEELAKGYDRRYNLAIENKDLFRLLSKYCEKSKDIMDIGCGTGNFLIPLSAYVEKAYGLDASKAMLLEAEKKASAQGCENISFIHTDLEMTEAKSIVPVDLTMSINSLYRVKSIVDALQTIYDVTKRTMIVVRTVQTPLLSAYYEKEKLPYEINRDYECLEKWFALTRKPYIVKTFYHRKVYEYNREGLFRAAVQRDFTSLKTPVDVEKIFTDIAPYYRKDEGYRICKKHAVMVYIMHIS